MIIRSPAELRAADERSGLLASFKKKPVENDNKLHFASEGDAQQVNNLWGRGHHAKAGDLDGGGHGEERRRSLHSRVQDLGMHAIL